jgi:DNA-binding PadR family transcriptional regulator
MGQAALLGLVSCHPHPTALARAAGTSLFPALRRLEEHGLVTRRLGLYRLTARGRSELVLDRALARAVVQAFAS